jgi:dTDP-4-amino-4,6-dideoxygalactose transaminase
MIPIAKPVVGEEEKALVLEVLGSGSLAQGAMVARLEAEFAAYCGVKHAIATSNGTTALHLAVLGHGIGPGDEVITVPFTFIASANSVVYTGGRPVFVDIEPDSYNLDPDRIEAAITPRTRAIMPVHLYGNPADMPRIREIADRHGLLVIEDAAQAHGAEIGGRRIGAWGDSACFSFYPTKNMTTAEGGMITTDDDDLADRLRLLRAQGMRKRYYHEVIGYNFRMTEIHAAIGVGQLHQVERFNAQRIANAAYLSAHLPPDKVRAPVVRPGTRHVFHQYTVQVLPPLDRDAARSRLAELGVGSEIYYPLPVHRQQPYIERGYGDEHYPVTEEMTRRVLSLPVHPQLSEADLAAIVAAVEAL